MKRIISLICVMALLMSTLVSSIGVLASESEVDVSVKFNSYEVSGDTTYLYVDLELSLPELEAFEDRGDDDYAWYGKAMNSLSWGVTFDSSKMTFNAKKTTQASVAKAQASGDNMVKVAWADTDYEKWYTGENPVWTLAFKVLDLDYAPVITVNPGDTAAAIVTFTGETAATPTDNNTIVYKATITEASGNEVPITYSVDTMKSYNALNTPTVPTADSIGLATSDGVALKNVAVKNDNGSEYTINSALVFVSCVDTDKATPVKTVITRGESDKELVINAKNTTAIGTKTYFAAAVSSIREDSFKKVFTAKAYAQAGDYLVEGAAATGTYAE